MSANPEVARFTTVDRTRPRPLGSMPSAITDGIVVVDTVNFMERAAFDVSRVT